MEPQDIFLTNRKDYFLSEIYYIVDDREYAPMLFKYTDFCPPLSEECIQSIEDSRKLEEYQNVGRYCFLLQHFPLPKELWYLIFEWKFYLEKIDYVNFYFSPETVNTETCLIHKTYQYDQHGTFYFKDDSVVGRIRNDFADISSVGNEKKYFTRSPHYHYEKIINLKKFVTKWYLWLFQIKEISQRDYELQEFEDFPIEELYFRGNYRQTDGFVRLLTVIESKVSEFHRELIWDNQLKCCRYHCLMSKVIISDLLYFMNLYIYECLERVTYKWSIEEPSKCSICRDFHLYYYFFDDWVSQNNLTKQEDLLKLKENEDLIHPRFDVNGDLCEEDNGEGKYFNKYWFEKDDDGDFILWKMIQNS